MDGYAFATGATAEAIDALKARVTSSGPGVRTVLPVDGSHVLYVAVSAAEAADVDTLLESVAGTAGLDGVLTKRAQALTFPDPAPDLPGIPWVDETLRGATPTWLAVSGFVGFALVGYASGDQESVVSHVAGDAVVVGAALLAGEGPRLLVEFSADDRATVDLALSRLGALAVVTSISTMVGEAAHGVGLALR